MNQPRKPSLLHRLSGAVGRRVLGILNYVVEITVFIIRSLRGWLVRGGIRNRANRAGLVTQLIFSGVDALPTLTILSLALGMGVIAQLIIYVQVLGSEKDVLGILVQLVVLELGSLITAIIVTGRSGSAITVDLGHMTLNQEVDGLELLRINIFEFLVAPRVIGLMIAQVVLAIYFSFFSVIAGVGIAALIESPIFYEYLYSIPQAVDGFLVLVFLAKNMFFGLLIGAAACYHGLHASVSPTELPQQAQRAIVNGLVLVFISDGLITLALQ